MKNDLGHSDIVQRTVIVLRRVQVLLLVFILGLAVSGLTAIPLETELNILARMIGADSANVSTQSGMVQWIHRVHEGLLTTNAHYPFLAYGTDWLAFAHIVIAIAFIGPLRDPIKNIWVIEWGMIACVLVIPCAFIMGGVRGIPWGWRLIDCSFGIFGIIPLWFCRYYIHELSALIDKETAQHYF